MPVQSQATPGCGADVSPQAAERHYAIERLRYGLRFWFVKEPSDERPYGLSLGVCTLQCQRVFEHRNEEEGKVPSPEGRVCSQVVSLRGWWWWRLTVPGNSTESQSTEGRIRAFAPSYGIVTFPQTTANTRLVLAIRRRVARRGSGSWRVTGSASASDRSPATARCLSDALWA